jgi:hypothetical protein
VKAIHWIGIGCCGCFLIVAIFLGILIGSGLYLKKKADNAQQVSMEVNQLNEKYPFTPPEDHRLSPDRFFVFLSARESLFNNVEHVLAPVINLAGGDTKPEEITTFTIIQGVARMLIKAPDFKVAQAEIFNRIEMSPQEYTYMTRVLAKEISRWIDLDKPKSQRETADAYFAPLMRFENNIQTFEKENPGANMDTGPFQYTRLMSHLDNNTQFSDNNTEIILENMNSIMQYPNTVFLDVWILEFN